MYVCVWTWVWVGGCYVVYLIGVIFNYTALSFSPPLSLLLWVTLCVIFNDSWNKWVVMRWPCHVVCLPHHFLSHSLSLWPEGHGPCVWSSVRMNQLQGKVMKLLVAWRVGTKSLMPIVVSLCRQFVSYMFSFFLPSCKTYYYKPFGTYNRQTIRLVYSLVKGIFLFHWRNKIIQVYVVQRGWIIHDRIRFFAELLFKRQCHFIALSVPSWHHLNQMNHLFKFHVCSINIYWIKSFLHCLLLWFSASKAAYLSRQSSGSEHVKAYSHPIPPTALVLAKMDILPLCLRAPGGKKLQLATSLPDLTSWMCIRLALGQKSHRNKWICCDCFSVIFTLMKVMIFHKRADFDVIYKTLFLVLWICLHEVQGMVLLLITYSKLLLLWIWELSQYLVCPPLSRIS